MKKVFQLFLMILLSLTFTHCSKDDDKSNEKLIAEFVIDNAKGKIDQVKKQITVSLDAGTDVKKLRPSLKISQNATVSPASGEEVDFTNPVNYTVTAEDGTQAVYTVTAEVAGRSTAQITSFKITISDSELIGEINEAEKTISVLVPYETNVTKLAPSITIAGKSVSPASGAQVNFTYPVKYTVTAEDGTKAEYTVTVTKAKDSEAKISLFKFSFTGSDVVGDINESAKTISAIVPYGTDITKLAPRITIIGKSVSPASREEVDFTNPVTYTVTAHNGTQVAYTVTVTEAKDSDAKISSFKLTVDGEEKAGNINEYNKTISLLVPYTTDVTKLTPDITIVGKSVSPASGTEVDFTNPVNYTVTAENGTELVYTVTVNKEDAPYKITQVSSFVLTSNQEFTITGIFADDVIVKMGDAVLPVNSFDGTTIKTVAPNTIRTGMYVLSVTTGGVVVEHPTKVDLTNPFMPVISFLNQTEYVRGSVKLVIHGSNFKAGDTHLKIGDLVIDNPSDFTIDNNGTLLTMNYSCDLSLGDYEVVVVSGGLQSNAAKFKVVISPSAPQIAQLDKAQYMQGYDKIVITGSNLSSLSGQNEVYFKMPNAAGYYRAVYAQADVTGKEIIVDVPTDLIVGKQQIYVKVGEQITNKVEIEIVENTNPVPVITSISDLRPRDGDIITITGANFSTDENEVKIFFYRDFWGDGEYENYGTYVIPTSVTETTIEVPVTGSLGEKLKVLIESKGKKGALSDYVITIQE